MPKFLAGCHYNEEEINRHLKNKKKGYWLVQVHGNKFATGQILEKPVEVVKGRILAGWAQKSPKPCKKCEILQIGRAVQKQKVKPWLVFLTCSKQQ